MACARVACASLHGLLTASSLPVCVRAFVSSSQLKRPANLALHDLQVPAQPSGVPPPVPPMNADADGEAGSSGQPLEALEGTDLDAISQTADVMTAISPLLASTFGIAPESMRSFLRLDDLTFDLLSPLGTGRPGAKSGLADSPSGAAFAVSKGAEEE